ncbi:MAG: DUF5057 domain-containing protein [Lachnospiraceae bacterium]|nr:DUF5057 domain-containing protein [Lachnospiraceae bacterium]
MSKKARIIISCFLVVLAFGAGIVSYVHAYGNRTEIANAEATDEFFVHADGSIDIPIEPMAGSSVTEAERDANRLTRGTEDNPLFILEIAPYEGEGQFAYHIAGQEPVDIQLMCWNYMNVYGESSLYTQTAGRVCIWEADFTSKYNTTNRSEDYVTQYGTMKSVSDGSGNYTRSAEVYTYETAPDDYAGTRYIHDITNDVYIEDPNGTWMQRVTGATYTPTTGGDYKWMPLSVEECVAIDADSDKKAEYENNYQDTASFKMSFENVKYYYRDNAKILTHNNYFLRESVGLAYNVAADGTRERILDEDVIAEKIKNYHVEVYTVTPEDLNANLDLIDRADLITFVTKDLEGNARGAYESDSGKYLKEGAFSRASEVPRQKNAKGATFDTHQLDWDTVVRIYDRVTDEFRPCPVLWDTNTYSDISAKDVTVNHNVTVANGTTKNINGDGVQNNLYKLYLLLYQMPQATLESLWGEPSSIASVSMGVSDKNGTLSTGVLDVYSNANANRYWNQFTLYPWSMLPDNASDKYKPMLDTLGIMSEGGIFNFGDGGAQNFIRNAVYRNDGGQWLHQGFMSASGVANDQYGHEVFDFFESIGEPKTTITSAECLYYLLNGLSANSPNTNKQYNVLQLQPSPSYQSDLYISTLVKLYGKTQVDPLITNMTTSEFIGKNVECISEYDMIYIGMLKKSGDPTMHTNFTYAHTGPKKESSYDIMYGWLNAGNNFEKYFVYSGNDLTEKAMIKLKDFADSGSALMFGDGFFTSASASTPAATIDRNSYVYELQNGISDKLYETALSDSTYHLDAKNAFQDSLAKARAVKLLNVEQPKLYVESASDAEKYINVTAGSGSDDRTLYFRFTLDAPTATQPYELKLYVDINGDGKFADNENIDVTVVEVGGTSTSRLYGGKTYRVSRPVEDRVGSISWKLDIVEAGDTVVQTSLSGVSAIKATAEETVTLHILQIMPLGGSTGRPATVYLPQDGEVVGTTVSSSIPAEYRDETLLFYQKTRNINGMDIKFIRMKESEIKTQLALNERYLLEADMDGDGTEDGYDMLIIGFADCYDGISDSDVYDAIEGFMAEGRAVLFTHDNSSLIGNGGWGQAFTYRFRDLFGMDRYDVLAGRGNPSYVDRDDFPYTTTSTVESTKTYVTNGNNQLLTQGVANGRIFQYTDNGGYNLKTTTVTKVNTGAITEYPYKIPETLSCAETHVQYYQLDYSRDDIVVWYCLSKTGDNYYQYTPNDVRNNYYIYNVKNVTYTGVGHNGSLTEDEIELFVNTFVAAYRAAADPVQLTITNDDAIKKNGTYYMCFDVNTNDPDKLIGNDIVHSYRTQEVDGEGYKLDETITHESRRVYFKLTNDNTYGNVSYNLQFFIDKTEYDDDDSTPLAVFKKDGDVFMDTLSTDTKFVAGDVEYYVDVPVTVEEKTYMKDGVEVTEDVALTTNLKISITMVYGDEDNETAPTYTDAIILPRGMFDLN